MISVITGVGVVAAAAIGVPSAATTRSVRTGVIEERTMAWVLVVPFTLSISAKRAISVWVGGAHSPWSPED